MTSTGVQWIVKCKDGRIEGPFSTEKVLHQIGCGELTGEELIARYPGGHWISISQEPQFYDRLLEALTHESGEVQFDPSATFNDGYDDERTQVSDKISAEDEEVTQPSFEVRKAISTQQEVVPESELPDLELVDTRPLLWKAMIRKSIGPAIVAAIAVLAGVTLIYILDAPSVEGRVRLLAPRQNQPEKPLDEVKALAVRGLANFWEDSLSSYITAQNNLVAAIEGNNKATDAMALLCMVYYELWPFSSRDAKDLRVVSQVVQMTTQVEPGGIHASVCRAVDLILKGRDDEAKSVVESALENFSDTQTQAMMYFYFIKAVLLADSEEVNTAMGYLRSAQKILPQWIRAFVFEAQLHVKQGNYNEAANILRRVVRSRPDHAVALIELGLAELRHFNQMDRAEQYLRQGLREPEVVARFVASKGYLGLAEIALKKGASADALSYAERAYQFNSSDVTAKNMIIQLGGADRLKKTRIQSQQYMFEGDQFVREGDFNAAQAHYKAAFEEDNSNSTAAMKAAQCLWELSFSTEAFDWLNRAIKSDPGLIEAYVLMADYHSQRYNFLAASQILASAQRVKSESYEVLRGFALVEFRRGNPSGALTFLRRALQLYETDIESLILMTEAHLALKEYREAFASATKAMEIDINSRLAQINYARALVGIRGVDAGVDYLSALVNSYPLVVEYRLALGELLLEDERHGSAEQVFRQVLRLRDNNVQAHILLSKVLRAQNRMQEALDELRRASLLDPADAVPVFESGLLYLEVNDPHKALNQLQWVLRINKLYPLVNYHMGRAALMMKDARQALQYANEEKKVNPNLADAYLLAAEAHSELGQFSLCAGEYQRAIRLRPQNAQIYVKLAQCYRKAGSLDVAIAMLNQAAIQESGLPDIYKEQGAIYEQKGDVLRAVEAYRQYFVLYPSAPDRQLIEQRILALQGGGTVQK